MKLQELIGQTDLEYLKWILLSFQAQLSPEAEHP
jgi:hypothetical protein